MILLQNAYRSLPNNGDTSRWKTLGKNWSNVTTSIDICTPDYFHHDMAIAAAEVGKMIVCEKPLAISYEETMAMTDAIEKACLNFSLIFLLPHARNLSVTVS